MQGDPGIVIFAGSSCPVVTLSTSSIFPLATVLVKVSSACSCFHTVCLAACARRWM